MRTQKSCTPGIHKGRWHLDRCISRNAVSTLHAHKDGDLSPLSHGILGRRSIEETPSFWIFGGTKRPLDSMFSGGRLFLDFRFRVVFQWAVSTVHATKVMVFIQAELNAMVYNTFSSHTKCTVHRSSMPVMLTNVCNKLGKPTRTCVWRVAS